MAMLLGPSESGYRIHVGRNREVSSSKMPICIISSKVGSGTFLLSAHGFFRFHPTSHLDEQAR